MSGNVHTSTATHSNCTVTNAEPSPAAGLLLNFQSSKYEALNQLKQKVDTKATQETELSW